MYLYCEAERGLRIMETCFDLARLGVHEHERAGRSQRRAIRLRVVTDVADVVQNWSQAGDKTLVEWSRGAFVDLLKFNNHVAPLAERGGMFKYTRLIEGADSVKFHLTKGQKGSGPEHFCPMPRSLRKIYDTEADVMGWA